MILMGGGSGYLFATRVLFPVASSPLDLGAVPDVRGGTAEEAARQLADAGLVSGVVDSIRHPTVPAGVVLGQGPLPGQLALPGAEVRLTVSLGAERRPVPDVVGVSLDRALVVLETGGFQVQVDSVEERAPRGRVVGSVPAPGTEVSLPQDVRLRVSLGPPLVEMPELLGMQEEAAMALLEELGLEIAEVESRFRFGRDQGLVVEQEPVGSTMVEEGAGVRLVVGRRTGGG